MEQGFLEITEIYSPAFAIELENAERFQHISYHLQIFDDFGIVKVSIEEL